MRLLECAQTVRLSITLLRSTNTSQVQTSHTPTRWLDVWIVW